MFQLSQQCNERKRAASLPNLRRVYLKSLKDKAYTLAIDKVGNEIKSGAFLCGVSSVISMYQDTIYKQLVKEQDARKVKAMRFGEVL